MSRASGGSVALSRLWRAARGLIIAPHDLRTADATGARHQVPREAAHDQASKSVCVERPTRLALIGRIELANPFNPETPPRHHLETARISGAMSKSGAKNQDLTSRAA